MYMKTLTQTIDGMSSIRLSNASKSKLVKIGARLSLKDGRARSMEEIIDLLLEVYEKHGSKE